MLWEASGSWCMVYVPYISYAKYFLQFTLHYWVTSSPNPRFDHLLESSHRDDSNKCSNIGFGEEIGIIEIKICTLSGDLCIRDWLWGHTWSIMRTHIILRLVMMLWEASGSWCMVYVPYISFFNFPSIMLVNFNRLFSNYFFTKSYVWPLVRIVSLKRF